MPAWPLQDNRVGPHRWPRQRCLLDR